MASWYIQKFQCYYYIQPLSKWAQVVIVVAEHLPTDKNVVLCNTSPQLCELFTLNPRDAGWNSWRGRKVASHGMPVSSPPHYTDVIMSAMASQITSLMIVYSTVYSEADQRKHQSSASLAFVRGIRRGPANSPHKWPVTRKMFPFDDVIMYQFKTTGSNSSRRARGHHACRYWRMILEHPC